MINPRIKIQPRWYWYAMLGIVFFEYTRPQDMLPFLAPLRLPGLVTLIAAAIFLLNDKKYIREDRVFTLLILFWLLVGITIVYAPNTRATFNVSMLLFWTFVGFVFPICAVVNSVEKIRKFFFFWLFVQTVLALEIIARGGRGPGSYVLDENDAALAMVMAIPYAIYLSKLPDLSKKSRLILYSVAGLLIVAVGVTASRGGVVGLAATILAIVFLSKRRIRNAIILTCFIALATPVLLSNLPESYVADMENMANPEDKTRDERLYTWAIAWQMYLHNPVIGVGAGNFNWTNHLYAHLSPLYDPERRMLGGRAAHSLYFTLISELGTVGTAIYLSIVIWMIRRYRELKRFIGAHEKPSAEMSFFLLIYKAMIASMVAFLASGTFITVLYYPPFWHLVGLFAVTSRAVKQQFPALSDSQNAHSRRRGNAPTAN